MRSFDKLKIIEGANRKLEESYLKRNNTIINEFNIMDSEESKMVKILVKTITKSCHKFFRSDKGMTIKDDNHKFLFYYKNGSGELFYDSINLKEHLNKVLPEDKVKAHICQAVREFFKQSYSGLVIKGIFAASISLGRIERYKHSSECK